jgi:translation initiation factor 2B subunit (eIF-2B alpha/beta/delta family)
MAVLRWIDQSRSMPWPLWKTELIAFAFALYDAQSAMAPFFNLVNDLLLALGSADAPEAVQTRVRQTLRAFLERSEQMQARLAVVALSLLSHGSRVLTFSYSSSILGVLLEAHAQRRLSMVYCTESRPMMEGQRLARALAGAGVAVEFGVDAAISIFAPRASVVLVGADGLTERGVVNKLGTTSVALMARQAGIPCYVIADRQKWLASAAELPDLTRSKPGEEVWPEPPKGVTVRNVYFESTPLELFEGITGENGLLTPEALRLELRDMPVAQAWRSRVKPMQEPG